MPERRPTAKAAAREATRAALLRAATEMLFEAPGADPIGALRPVDVGRRAVPPRSTGAFYNIWPTQADFRRDLLRHVLSVDRTPARDATLDAFRVLLSSADFSLQEMVRVSANLSFDEFKDDSAMQLRQALWSRHASDPEACALLAGQYDSLAAELLPFYAAILERSGRRMRAPFTIDHLGVAVAAVFEGLRMRWAVQPEAVPELGAAPESEETSHQGRTERWTLCAAATYVLILGMTEPAERPG